MIYPPHLRLIHIIFLIALNSEEDVCSGEHVIEALRAHRWIISNEEQVFFFKCIHVNLSHL